MMDGWRSGGSSMSGSSPNVFHIIRLAFCSIIDQWHKTCRDRRARQRKKKLHTICMEPELQGRDAQVAVSPPVRPWQPADQGRQGRQISAGLLDHGLQI